MIIPIVQMKQQSLKMFSNLPGITAMKKQNQESAWPQSPCSFHNTHAVFLLHEKVGII